MALPTHILLTYGYLLLFAWVLTEQLGVPLPSVPLLVAAGALSAEGQISFPLALLVGLVAALTADGVWFLVGRHYGHRVLGLLCKLSLEPTICVRRAHDSFGHHRVVTLMIAKFAPGLATLAPAVAGEIGMGFVEFLFFDSIGVTFWLSAWLVVGRLFGDVLKRDPSLLAWVVRFSGTLLVVAVLVFLVYRVRRYQSALKGLIATRIEPKDLKRHLDAGENVYIVDLRHPLELLPDPFTLPGAHHISPDALASLHLDIPRDRDVVLYCTCPNEATSARTAMALHKLGIERVRPLRGGYDEWKRLGYPLEPLHVNMPSMESAQTT